MRPTLGCRQQCAVGMLPWVADSADITASVSCSHIHCVAWAGAGRAGAADASAEHAANAGRRKRQGAVGMLRISGDCSPALMSALQRLSSEARGLVPLILYCRGVLTRQQAACCREAGTACSTGLDSQVSSDVRGSGALQEVVGQVEMACGGSV